MRRQNSSLQSQSFDAMNRRGGFPDDFQIGSGDDTYPGSLESESPLTSKNERNYFNNYPNTDRSFQREQRSVFPPKESSNRAKEKALKNKKSLQTSNNEKQIKVVVYNESEISNCENKIQTGSKSSQNNYLISKGSPNNSYHAKPTFTTRDIEDNEEEYQRDFLGPRPEALCHPTFCRLIISLILLPFFPLFFIYNCVNQLCRDRKASANLDRTLCSRFCAYIPYEFYGCHRQYVIHSCTECMEDPRNPCCIECLKETFRCYDKPVPRV